ncbi:MAG: FAD-binding protein [Acidimicrobiales bacterium]
MSPPMDPPAATLEDSARHVVGAALSVLPDRVVRDPQLLAFAELIGGPEDGPVAVEGGRTQWSVGGPAASDVRLVQAPCGVVAFEPAEMTVQVRAGTTLAELDAVLAAEGQEVALRGFDPAATVGGVLSVGRSGITRLGHGPIRDTLLQARYVSAEGLLVTAGGPTVKNVTGFDLPRLLVGALGTVGLLAEVILRTRPRPRRTRWMAGPADPFAVRDALYRPISLLWDGTVVWVLLEGHAADVDQQGAVAATLGLVPVEGPPPLPAGRRSLDPGRLRSLASPETGHGAGGAAFVAEIGVGVLHGRAPLPAGVQPPPPDPAVVRLNHAIRDAFDPTGRLNPGRDPLRADLEPADQERGERGW